MELEKVVLDLSIIEMYSFITYVLRLLHVHDLI